MMDAAIGQPEPKFNKEDFKESLRRQALEEIKKAMTRSDHLGALGYMDLYTRLGGT